MTMHYRKMTVRGENIRIGDVLPSGAVVDLITIENNEQREISGVRYSNDKPVTIKRKVSSKGFFGNANALGKTRVSWEDRVEELHWLVDGGVSPLVATEKVAPGIYPLTWIQHLKGPENKALRKRIRTAMNEE